MYGQRVRMVYLVSCLICLIHPSLSSVIKDYVKCTEGSMKSDPEDCGSYYQCLDAESLRMKCPDGSYFEAKNEVCVVDEQGICPTSKVICNEGELQEDSSDSAGYLRCLGGNLVQEKCPSNSYFNKISKSCSLFTLRETCAEGEVEADPTNCAGYLVCKDGLLVSKTCASGSYFEPTHNICIIDVNGVCVEPPPKCTEGQVTLDPNNCAGYLKCIDGELVEDLCPSGSYFHPRLETCVVDNEGICVTNILICNEGEIGVDPKDCAGYRECIRGEVANLKCAPGRYFNATEADCLLDVENVCVKARAKDEGSEGMGNREFSEREENFLNNNMEMEEATNELRPKFCGCNY